MMLKNYKKKKLIMKSLKKHFKITKMFKGKFKNSKQHFNIFINYRTTQVKLAAWLNDAPFKSTEGDLKRKFFD